MSSFRFASPCVFSEAALSAGAISVAPNSALFDLGKEGWDASLLYGLHGTQSKLWGLAGAYQAAADKPGIFVAIDWVLESDVKVTNFEGWGIAADNWISSPTLRNPLLTVLDGQSNVLVLKNMKAGKVRALSDLWHGAAKAVYGDALFEQIEAQNNVNWDVMTEYCSAYPLAASGLLKAIPALDCLVFPRIVTGREFWFGCMDRSKLGQITQVSARGHSQVVVSLS